MGKYILTNTELVGIDMLFSNSLTESEIVSKIENLINSLTSKESESYLIILLEYYFTYLKDAVNSICYSS